MFWPGWHDNICHHRRGQLLWATHATARANLSGREREREREREKERDKENKSKCEHTQVIEKRARAKCTCAKCALHTQTRCAASNAPFLGFFFSIKKNAVHFSCLTRANKSCLSN